MSYIINEKPGRCTKCAGTGQYGWGTFVNGKPTFSGTCFGCGGTGQQTATDIRRNTTASRYGPRCLG